MSTGTGRVYWEYEAAGVESAEYGQLYLEAGHCDEVGMYYWRVGRWYGGPGENWQVEGGGMLTLKSAKARAEQVARKLSPWAGLWLGWLRVAAVARRWRGGTA